MGLPQRGLSPNVIRGMNLSTEEGLARLEAQVSGDDEDAPPGAWLKPV
jgi:hypothetical protein